ncbi:MAG: hypothetical protein AB2719_16675 [Candidatus Thiodiazotropha sp.]
MKERAKDIFKHILGLSLAFFEGVHCYPLLDITKTIISADTFRDAAGVVQAANLHEFAAFAALVHFLVKVWECRDQRGSRNQ